MHPNYNDRLTQIETELKAKVPEFVKLVIESPQVDVVMMHQDAWAGDLQSEEFALLGKAIKFAGHHGKQVMFTGHNGETFSRPSAS